MKKRFILLSACGPTTYKLIRSLLEINQLNRETYDDLVKLVIDYFNPKPFCIVQQYKFNTKSRASGKSNDIYVAALQKLAEFCDYKDSLQEMLRDWIVCGANREGIQRQLLSEKSFFPSLTKFLYETLQLIKMHKI